MKVDAPTDNPIVCLLAFTNRWYVGSTSGCSCTFRHLVSTELGFGETVDWYSEEKAEIEATRELRETISSLLLHGH